MMAASSKLVRVAVFRFMGGDSQHMLTDRPMMQIAALGASLENRGLRTGSAYRKRPLASDCRENAGSRSLRDRSFEQVFNPPPDTIRENRTCAAHGLTVTLENSEVFRTASLPLATARPA